MPGSRTRPGRGWTRRSGGTLAGTPSPRSARHRRNSRNSPRSRAAASCPPRSSLAIGASGGAAGSRPPRSTPRKLRRAAGGGGCGSGPRPRRQAPVGAPFPGQQDCHPSALPALTEGRGRKEAVTTRARLPRGLQASAGRFTGPRRQSGPTCRVHGADQRKATRDAGCGGGPGDRPRRSTWWREPGQHLAARPAAGPAALAARGRGRPAPGRRDGWRSSMRRRSRDAGYGGDRRVGHGGSSRPPAAGQGLSYTHPEANADPVAVRRAKGITFRPSGRPCRSKPPKSMETMKCDMSGAARRCSPRSPPSPTLCAPGETVVGYLCAAEKTLPGRRRAAGPPTSSRSTAARPSRC